MGGDTVKIGRNQISEGFVNRIEADMRIMVSFELLNCFRRL